MGRGRVGSGVEVLKHSLRVRFTYQGKRRAENLDLAPTPGNIKAAQHLMAQIRQKISLGVFDYEATFPNSANVEKAAMPLFSDYVETWIDTLTCEKSTGDGFKTTLRNFWRPAFAGKRWDQIKYTDVAAAIAAKSRTASAQTTNNNADPPAWSVRSCGGRKISY